MIVKGPVALLYRRIANLDNLQVTAVALMNKTLADHNRHQEDFFSHTLHITHLRMLVISVAFSSTSCVPQGWRGLNCDVLR